MATMVMKGRAYALLSYLTKTRHVKKREPRNTLCEIVVLSVNKIVDLPGQAFHCNFVSP